MRQHAFLRRPYRAVVVPLQAVFFLWFPYLLAKPVRAKFLVPYLVSLRPGATPWGTSMPLVTFEAAEWLKHFLTRDKIVFEYGSGGSTLFSARRAKKLVSVEHDKGFYELIGKLLVKNNLKNCEYILREPVFVEGFLSRPEDYRSFSSSASKYIGYSFEQYCKSIRQYPEEFFDLVFVDGRARPSCIFQALGKIKPGGFLMLDDSARDEFPSVVQLLGGWRKQIFRGPKLYGLIGQVYQTTVWQKPDTQQGISTAFGGRR